MIVYNQFQPPLPRVSVRDIVAMRIWIPEGMSLDSKIGESAITIQLLNLTKAVILITP